MSVTASWRLAIGQAVGAGAAGLLVAALPLPGQAQQARTVADGVYSAAQAARGRQVYEARCASCHGAALDGAVGPPLTADAFLSIWAARPLADLADKIEKTMPPQQAGSVSRQQAADLTAYVLQAGGFPSGRGELTPDALAQISLPAAPVSRGTAAPAAPAFAPAANLAQLMRALTFPNANIVFNVQVKDPGAEKPSPPIPFDFVAWGATVYYGWQAVDQAALALIESTPLFLVSGRRCENGRPVPVDRPDWRRYTAALVDASRLAYRASQSRSAEAVVQVADRLNEACANCHKAYRDGPAEGTGKGALRC
jgi:mono/diheme cytochrome c family protein